MRRLVVGSLIVVVLGVACGGEGSADTSVSVSSTAGGGSTVTTDGSTTTVPPASSEMAESLGLDAMAILTPESGGGDRPDLEWAPVDGAVRYQVTVLAPDGSIYWGWTGHETLVPFGGFPRLIPEAAGPRIIEGMSWTVVAFDESTMPLAIGGPKVLSP